MSTRVWVMPALTVPSFTLETPSCGALRSSTGRTLEENTLVTAPWGLQRTLERGRWANGPTSSA